MEKKYITENARETELFGSKLAEKLKKDSFIALYGDMGAGKTVFVRGVVEKLIPDAVKLVHSPTFALVNEYIGDEVKIYHFDMYRISDVDELYAIGFDDYFGNGIIITEWSENIPDSIPSDAVSVSIRPLDENRREITLRGLEI